MTLEIPAILGFACLLISGGYVWAALAALAVWKLVPLSRARTAMGQPAITVLKPLCGAESRLYESLRSFFLQDYREFQIVFGVRDPSDPAIRIVERLAKEFPAVPIELVIDAHLHGANHKVSNLINMLPFARHEVLVIVDSDAQVDETYLATIVAAIQQDSVGLVTCTYRSVPTGGLWSRLGALYINDWYMPSVLLSWLLGHRGFASGQTLCLRRETLESLGGLQPICNHLADDYELGERVRAAGLKTVLSEYVTRSQHHEPTLAHLLDHEIRWMRTLRALRPGEFRLLFVSFGLPLAVVGLMLACSLRTLIFPSVLLFSGVVFGRLALHAGTHWDGKRIDLSDLWLIPLRDVLLMWVWWRALRTSQVSWRGSRFAVNAQGMIRPVS